MDTINQQHEFNGKIYKTLTSAKSARTRYRNKKIKELLQQEQTETIVNKIKKITDKINKEKQDKKDELKRKKELQKLGFNIYQETTKKSQEERLKLRKKEYKKNKKDIKDIDFKTKDLLRKYETKALGGRITENYLYDNLNNYQNRNNIIISNIMNQLYKAQNDKLLLKSQLTLKFIVRDEKEQIEYSRYATSLLFNINTKNDILNLIDNLMIEYERVLEQINIASNLTFKGFEVLIIRSSRQTRKEYRQTMAGNYIELSDEIKKSKGVMNIKNIDNKCVEYCLIAFRYQNQIKSKDTSNPNIYKKYFQFIKSPENQKYPINIEEDMPKYEELNDIKIVVYRIKNEQFLLHFKSNYKSKEKEILNLLLVEDGDKNHLCLIKNISRLTNHLNTTNTNNKTYYCENCNNFSSCRLEALEKHLTICEKNEQSFIKLPTKGKDDIMKFMNYQNEFEHPFVCFVDFESTLEKIDKRDDQEKINLNDSTQYYQKHTPNSFGLKFDCIHREFSKQYQSNLEEDDNLLCKIFIEELEKLAKSAYDLTQINKTNIIWKNKDEEIKHKNNSICDKCYCRYNTKNKKVAHHDHINGDFIGSYCNTCNLKYQYKKFLPVYIHNLKGYDSHLFISALFNYGCFEKKITCIPNNEEQYISFSKSIKVDEYNDKDGNIKPVLFEIRFVDTYAILSSSLDGLVENLKKDCKDINELRNKFRNTSEAFNNDDDFKFMISKGVYPYEYIDNFNKLYETKLPHRKYFYSRLNNTHIKPKEYARALQVFKHFNCKNIKDYHELYLKADVLLLSDIWYNFKKVCLTNYKLDPTYYYTAPSLSWDAFLKISEIELELITDYEMYLFIEEGIRGGLSQISKRFSKANNKYMKNYDNTKEDTYINYFDANNLYGWAMCEYLPYKNFKWNEEEWNKEKILNLDDKANTGYLFNVDLKIPDKLHDYFNNYCPLPLNKTIKKNELNEFQTKDYKESNIKKLCCSLDDRKEYKINYRMLKLVLNLGFELIKVNKVLQYEQKPFMKKYIMLNTELRTKAKTDFEKDFFKLMNNSCYGKTMENVRNRIEFKLVSNEAEFDKVKRIKKVSIFNENLVGVHISKYSVKLNKPIYIGQCVLDDSKLLMNNFHYNFMMKKIDEGNLKLLFTDTDSLCYEIKNQDIYEIMKNNKDEFDLSNFTNNLYDGTNKKVIGKFKDESADSPIIEFVGLRSKVYSYLTNDDHNSKKNKGIKKSVVEKFITHNDYKECLFNKTEKYIVQNTFRSFKHNIYTVSQRKKGLSGTDDKVYICDDNINTFTHGHYKTKK